MKRLPLILGLVLVLADIAPGAADQPSLKEVLARAAQYARRYGETLSTVLAEEEYHQALVALNGREFDRRILRSEIAFVQLADGDEWVAFRNVFEIDGQAVPEAAGRLERLFRDTPAAAIAQARAIARESASYNLGPLQRNFNVPTTVLQFLLPAHQPGFEFKKTGEEERAGERVWVLAFAERADRTMIRTPGGKRVRAKGRIWVVPGDGRVVATELTADDFIDRTAMRVPLGPVSERLSSRSHAVIRVGWRRDDRLGVWVPAEMTERYDGPWLPDGATSAEDGFAITGVATYSNYRRFEVDVRIKKP